jgi:hypothetical protein
MKTFMKKLVAKVATPLLIAVSLALALMSAPVSADDSKNHLAVITASVLSKDPLVQNLCVASMTKYICYGYIVTQPKEVSKLLSLYNSASYSLGKFNQVNGTNFSADSLVVQGKVYVVGERAKELKVSGL